MIINTFFYSTAIQLSLLLQKSETYLIFHRRRVTLISKTCPPELTIVERQDIVIAPDNNIKTSLKIDNIFQHWYVYLYNDHFDFNVCLYPVIYFTIFVTVLPIRALFQGTHGYVLI